VNLKDFTIIRLIVDGFACQTDGLKEAIPPSESKPYWSFTYNDGSIVIAAGSRLVFEFTQQLMDAGERKRYIKKVAFWT